MHPRVAEYVPFPSQLRRTHLFRFSRFLCFSGLYRVITKVAIIRTLVRTQTQPFVPFYWSESRLEPVSRESGKQTWIQCEVARYSRLSNEDKRLRELTLARERTGTENGRLRLRLRGPVAHALVMKIPGSKVRKRGASK